MVLFTYQVHICSATWIALYSDQFALRTLHMHIPTGGYL